LIINNFILVVLWKCPSFHHPKGSQFSPVFDQVILPYKIFGSVCLSIFIQWLPILLIKSIYYIYFGKLNSILETMINLMFNKCPNHWMVKFKKNCKSVKKMLWIIKFSKEFLMPLYKLEKCLKNEPSKNIVYETR